MGKFEITTIWRRMKIFVAHLQRDLQFLAGVPWSGRETGCLKFQSFSAQEWDFHSIDFVKTLFYENLHPKDK